MNEFLKLVILLPFFTYDKLFLRDALGFATNLLREEWFHEETRLFSVGTDCYNNTIDSI